MNYSSKIIQNGYTRKDGAQAIYLRIIIHRKKKLIPVGLQWPTKYFDKNAGRVKPRFKNDPDAKDYNLLIGDVLAKANETFKYFRLTKLPLTIPKFIKEYKSDLSREDFLKYYSAKAKERLKNKEIEQSTYDDHMITLVKVEQFSAHIIFTDFDEEWAWKFDGFLKKQGININGRWKYHKNVRTYLNLARKKDHVKLVYPYEYFTAKQAKGSWRPLYEDDIKKLWEFYTDPRQAIHLKLAVLRFLFMCYTGLRRSDLDRVEKTWNQDGMLSFIEKKNRRYGRITEVPLCRAAQSLFQDAVSIASGRTHIFKYFSEPNSNRHLKKVAQIANIKANLHHHAGRHTFITLFLKNGGPLDLASRYAGHATIKQTMTYNHPDDERNKKAIEVMDNLMGDPFADGQSIVA